MTRPLLVALVLLAVIGGPATAQPPTWNPHTGWDTDIDRQIRDMQTRTLERVAETRRDIEETRRRIEQESRDTETFMTGFFVILVGVLVVVAVAQLARERRPRRRRYAETWTPTVEYQPLIDASPMGTVDVTVLRIAIDGRASKFVQTELASLVKAHDGLSAQGRAKRLREVSILLRRVRDSWIYGGADNEPLRSRDEALAVFARHVDEARTRILHPPTSAAAPSSAIPVSLILVSIVVAARGELMTVNPGATGEDLRRALEAAVHRAADELLAVEIVWAPTEPSHTLSSLDLEASYRRSELHPLDGALVGKVFCTYCTGPFPAELVTCPHCGAPAPGRERRSA